MVVNMKDDVSARKIDATEMKAKTSIYLQPLGESVEYWKDKSAIPSIVYRVPNCARSEPLTRK